MKSLSQHTTKLSTSPVPHTSDPYAQIVKRRLLDECPLNKSVSHFPLDIVSQAIQNSSNSLAAGPDGLIIHHLKNICPLRSTIPRPPFHTRTQPLQYLCQLFYNFFPKIIAHIPIPGKPADLGTSYLSPHFPPLPCCSSSGTSSTSRTKLTSSFTHQTQLSSQPLLSFHPSLTHT